VDASRTIRARIEEVASTIAKAATELRERASADTREAARSRQQVDRELDGMAALHKEMQTAIGEARTNSDQLARDIAAAVVAMQFQDAVSQRIGHVVRTLEELYASLQSRLDGAAPPSEMDDWRQRMTQSYTMAAEHRVLAGVTGQETAPAGELGDNVELF